MVKSAHLPSFSLPLFPESLLGPPLLCIQPAHPSTVTRTPRPGEAAMLPLVRAHGAALKIKTICAVRDFQSRLRKGTQMKSFVLSGLKNSLRSRWRGCSSKTITSERGDWAPRAWGEAPENSPPPQGSPLFRSFKRK